MTTYNSRKGPNMSQFIANLNTIDSQPADDLFSAQDDLSLFASTDFFDFDMGDTLNVPGTDFDLSRGDQKSSTSNWQASSGTAGQDFLNSDFSFSELQNFGSIGASNNSNGLNFPLTGAQSQITSPTSATSPLSTSAPRTGEKRKSVTASSSSNNDEQARHAAEEDKRRRNTAASARFRVKKKQREQALEKTAKEMTERASLLETRVQQLEMENKWLKGLITEREVGGDNKVNVIGKGALDELFEKFKREERSRSSDGEGERDD